MHNPIRRNALTGVGNLDAKLEQRAVPDSPLTGFDSQAFGDYITQANPWNAAPGDSEKFVITAKQTRLRDMPGVRFEVTKNEANIGSIPGAPIAYPSTFIGESFGRKPKGHKSVGIKQSEIKSAIFRFKTNATQNIGRTIDEKPGIYNTAIDVWLGGNDRSPNEYLMVMPYNSAANQMADGTGQGVGQPAGKIVQQNVTINGIQYNIWRGINHEGKFVTTFVAAPGQGDKSNDFQADLNEFLTYARQNRFISKEAPLNNVYGGSEIWAGGKGLVVDFGIDVQKKMPQVPGTDSAPSLNAVPSPENNSKTVEDFGQESSSASGDRSDADPDS